MAGEFTGSTKQCMNVLIRSKRLYKRRDSYKVGTTIGINPNTFYQWMIHCGGNPESMNLVKIRLFLSLIGFRVLERELIDSVVLELGDQLALGLYPKEKIMAMVGITNDETLRAWLQGKRSVHKKHLPKLRDYCLKHRGLARKKILEMRKKLERYAFSQVVLPCYLSDEEDSSIVNDGDDIQKRGVIEAFIDQISATISLGRVFTTSAMPADYLHVKRTLRKRGLPGIVGLANLLLKISEYT